MNKKYANLHSHTEYSNIKVIDSINGVEELIDRAVELGMSGVAITDHEVLSAHVKATSHYNKLKDNGLENFKLVLGDEIYLVEDIEQRKLHHFILLAKNQRGFDQLKEISSTAWKNSNGRRTPITKEQLKNIIGENKGNLIGSTACIGGEIGSLILELDRLEKDGASASEVNSVKGKIVNFIDYCKDLFGEDFYFEVQPSNQEEQVIVNARLKAIASLFSSTKTIVTTDAHYLSKKERYVHKAYLNSKEAEREVDDFYESAYLMSTSEIEEFRSIREVFSTEEMEVMYKNTNDIVDLIEDYSLFQEQEIPSINLTFEIPEFEMMAKAKTEDYKSYPSLLKLMTTADDEGVYKYWFYRSIAFLKENNKHNEEYLSRLEIEASELFIISENLQVNMFSYYTTMAKIIDICWDKGDTLIGTGRGSANGFLSCYTLGITQVDSIAWDLPWWRHISKERPELPDVDFDTQASRRKNILLAMKEFFGEANVLNIATFGTEGTKSAILTTCRGLGIDIDIAQYLTSLIPVERGTLWPIKDVISGNIEKDRKPVIPFIKEAAKYGELLEIAQRIEGLICNRSIHASGVYIFNSGFLKHNAVMKAPSGQYTSQFDMADSDYMGGLKYDFLTIDAMDKIRVTLDLLIEDEVITQCETLKETYDKYINPDILDYSNKDIWDLIGENKIISLFQFDTPSGKTVLEKVQPSSLVELAHANSLMRLMGEKGGDTPADKFSKFKENLKLWYSEMADFNLTKEEVQVMESHLLSLYGVAATQEEMMIISMDKRIAGFNLTEANGLRKAVAKKKADAMEKMKKLFFEKCSEHGTSDNLAKYVWQMVMLPQAGYSFSKNHTVPYSIIAFQEALLFNSYSPLYWNTACLTVGSGSFDEYIDEDFLEDEEEGKGKNTNYGKIATAINSMTSAGVVVEYPDINKAKRDFRPDIENSKIIFGLQGVFSVGESDVQKIIEGRPYTSFEDFMGKCKIKKGAVLSLIKAGAFDSLNKDREGIMAKYIELISEPKKKLTMSNLAKIIEYGLMPSSKEEYRALFSCNLYMKTLKKGSTIHLDSRAYNFIEKALPDVIDLVKVGADGSLALNERDWKKVYDKAMLPFKNWLVDNNVDMTEKFNKHLFNMTYQDYATGTLSSWEMDSICYYKHEHELADINKKKYGIVDFRTLPEEPIIDKFFKTRMGVEIPIYRLSKIAGTVIHKDKIRKTFFLLTQDEVLEIRLNAEMFSLYDKQISVVGEDGKKKVVEKSWFTRGNKLTVIGFRRGSSFIPKKYKNTEGHRLGRISEIKDNGDLIIVGERYGQADED